MQTAANLHDEHKAHFSAVEALFKGRHLHREIVVLYLRWYPGFRPGWRGSQRDERYTVESAWVYMYWATKVTLDACAASNRATAEPKESGELPNQVQILSTRYLHHPIERDCRRVKQRFGPMLRLKFQTAPVLISSTGGGEDKKGQYEIVKPAGTGSTMPASGQTPWLQWRERFESKRGRVGASQSTTVNLHQRGTRC